MRCRFSEDLIALYIEGDLQKRHATKVEDHLSKCAECRATAHDLRDSVDAFKSFRALGIDAVDLADTHRRVHREVERAEGCPGFALQLERTLYTGFRRRWLLAGSGAVVCCLVTVFAWSLMEKVWLPGKPSSVAAVSTGNLHEASAPNSDLRTLKALPAMRRRRSEAKTIPPPEAESKSSEIFVKVFTDDPNVVIYWFLEQKGETE